MNHSGTSPNESGFLWRETAARVRLRPKDSDRKSGITEALPLLYAPVVLNFTETS